VKNVLSGHVILLLLQSGTMQVSGDVLPFTSPLANPSPGLGFKPESFTQHINLNENTFDMRSGTTDG
jgi:hypothetical protein